MFITLEFIIYPIVFIIIVIYGLCKAYSSNCSLLGRNPITYVFCQYRFVRYSLVATCFWFPFGQPDGEWIGLAAVFLTFSVFLLMAYAPSSSQYQAMVGTSYGPIDKVRIYCGNNQNPDGGCVVCNWILLTIFVILNVTLVNQAFGFVNLTESYDLSLQTYDYSTEYMEVPTKEAMYESAIHKYIYTQHGVPSNCTMSFVPNHFKIKCQRNLHNITKLYSVKGIICGWLPIGARPCNQFLFTLELPSYDSYQKALESKVICPHTTEVCPLSYNAWNASGIFLFILTICMTVADELNNLPSPSPSPPQSTQTVMLNNDLEGENAGTKL